MKRALPGILALIAVTVSACAAQSGWSVVSSHWRPDENQWANSQVWETHQWGEGWKDPLKFYPDHFKPAGSVHIVLRNDSGKSDSISLTRVDGKPLGDVVTTPQKAGRVVWHRIESHGGQAAQVQPGDWAECTVRLRETPGEAVWLRFENGSGEWTETAVSPTPYRLRIESVSFSPAIDKVLIYVRALDGKAVAGGTLQLDGRDCTDQSQWTPGPSGLSLVEARLNPGWTYGTFHLIEIKPSGERALVQTVRAWDSYFCIGMFGEVDAKRVQVAKQRGINTYFAPPSDILAKQGMNTIPTGPANGTPRTTGETGMLFYYNHDEPDAHDWEAGKALPIPDRLGVNAQRLVLPLIRSQREASPTVPSLVLIDNTYKPLGWYVYGQIADVIATDPYVPLRGRQIDYVWQALEPARDGCAPKPLVSVLWACSLGKNKGAVGSNPPTSDEERMAVFYALGCGVKGIGYFIDIKPDPVKKSFIGLSEIQPLYEEIGRINRDVAVLAPYLARGCAAGEPVKQDETWSRSIMCGADAVVAIAVNRSHRIDFESKDQVSKHVVAEDEVLRIDLSRHFKNPRVREVKDGKLAPAKAEMRKSALHIKMEKLDTARAFLVQNSRNVDDVTDTGSL